ncbi:Molybdopterin synthase sulfur carrier subunit [Frankliniella fusca]|uniref:Molybdopterin synthase sulfur carrier subunit n=1 Tax=Frankliniella fusca TaxID=407009 RepID=A0AAE1HGR7_9NEOP|nr:Molybdopterin synthase sulfur carrier subunit [Frankliniella fusca]
MPDAVELPPPQQQQQEEGGRLVAEAGEGAGAGAVSLRVLLFAGARELAGTAEGVLTGVPARTDAAHLLGRVTEAFSLGAMAGSFILALNHDYVMPGDRVRVRDGDELAVIPPLSGG